MRKFEIVKDEFRKTNGEIKLPVRSDPGSAAYDFFSPVKVVIKPGHMVVIPLDIKAQMEKDEVLLLFVRSSIGIKRNLMLSNQVGVIDSTYYNNETNDGCLMCALYNYGNKKQIVEVGDRVIQGMFVKYLITEDDKPTNAKRTGGIGSSGK